jgi:hypothetical protein
VRFKYFQMILSAMQIGLHFSVAELNQIPITTAMIPKKMAWISGSVNLMRKNPATDVFAGKIHKKMVITRSISRFSLISGACAFRRKSCSFLPGNFFCSRAPECVFFYRDLRHADQVAFRVCIG